MKVAVIGLGYVGLPLAPEATLAGLGVVGYDSSPSVVKGLREASSHVDDISSEEIGGMLARATPPNCEPSALADAEVFAVCVPTPLTPGGGPDLTEVESAATSVGVPRLADFQSACFAEAPRYSLDHMVDAFVEGVLAWDDVRRAGL